jgi:hypothetical protein
MVTPGQQLGHRWRARSRAGFFVSAAAFAIPLALSVLAAFLASILLPHPTSTAWHVAWWVGILLISWAAALLGERLARPLLPLASLLKMSMLFPDRAPSRFAIAWRSGSTRQLDRYIHGHQDTTNREPMEAAVEILTLVTSLSSHDRRTRGHSERVRAYTDLLATELRLPQGDIDRLRWASLLHDVGKMSVDTKILNKSGDPTEAEWEVLRQHPIEGSRLIEPIREWLGEWGLAVEQHHENFDGSGYPFGLAGDEISYGARIVSVADAFEVMTAPRSYKTSMSSSAARKELTRCAGTQFDPAIVRAFLNASVGRQRWVIGPLTWVLDVPVVSLFGNLGNVLVASSQVALVTGSMALGAVAASAHDTMSNRSADVSATTAFIEHQPVVAELTSSTVPLDGTFRGGAIISDATSGTGGTVTYEVFDNANCLVVGGGLVATIGEVNVTEGSVPESPRWTAPPKAGRYYFVAVYSGDATVSAATSGCGAAPFFVTPDAPTILTHLSTSSTTVGAPVVARATLVGATPGANGTMTYEVYANADCSTSDGGVVATLGPVPVSGGAAASAPGWSPSSAGTYYFVALYSGDGDNRSGASSCDASELKVAGNPVTPTPPTPPSSPPTTPSRPTTPSPPTPPGVPPAPNSPTIATQASAASVAIGSTVFDSASLSGATANASGTVTYQVFDNPTCSSAAGGLVATLGSVSVASAAVPSSPSWTATEPSGTVYFVATYNGDSGNNATSSACDADPVNVTAATPTLSTRASAATVMIGNTESDSATLSAVTADASGTVTYEVLNNAICATGGGGLVATVGTVSVTSGIVAVSPAWTASEPTGTYYFVATYSGDANNATVTSACGGDPVVVAPDGPSITTQSTATFVAIGSTAYDTATLYAATPDASGTVTYDVFNNGSCSSAAGGLVATLPPVVVTNAVVPLSPGWTAAGSPGTYYFVALYSGDANNAAAQSGCSADPFAIG